VFSPVADVAGGGQGGGVRPSGGACSALVLKEEEVAGWAKRPNRSMGRLGRVGPETKEKFLSE
jgi:hypothetical protein